MVRVRATKVRATKVSKKYKNAFSMKPGPAQKTKIKGIKVKPKRKL